MGFNFRVPIFILTYQIGNGFQPPFTHFRFNTLRVLSNESSLKGQVGAWQQILV